MLDIFVSLVVPIHNVQDTIEGTIKEIGEVLSKEVTDYECILVDNGSTDRTVQTLESLSQELPNLQVYCLSTRQNRDIAVLSGMEQAIGDFVIVYQPGIDDLRVLPEMLQKTQEGYDVVLARAETGQAKSSSFLYNLLSGVFMKLFQFISKLDLQQDAPRYRVLSRRVLNFILQHDSAFIMHQMLPVVSGFNKMTIDYKPSKPIPPKKTSVSQGIQRAIDLLISTSTIPIRIVTFTFTLSAVLSIMYTFVVIGIYLVKDNTAPGWTPLSLQISGLFFLLSTALAIMSEYIVRIAAMTSKQPLYFITKEFRSSILTQEQRLNVFREGRHLRMDEAPEGTDKEDDTPDKDTAKESATDD